MAPGRLDSMGSTIGVKISTTHLRAVKVPCIATTKDDRVSQEIAPHTVTFCEIAVCRSTINAGSDRWPVRLQTRVRWSSALRLNRFITEDDTSPVCHTLSCSSDVVGAEVATLLIARSLAIICVPGTSLTLRDGTLLPSVILLPTPSNYHIAFRPEVAADAPIRPTCFSEAHYTAPMKVPSSAARTAGLRLRGHLSLNIVYQSHQDSFG
ncbi:hypothetical protein TNCV_1365891 [Trichonephila clavipes]|nr:hypothetical protein TNCV_1365891 [Trichonephila clavipes]